MLLKRIGITISALAVSFAGATAQAAFVDSFEVGMFAVNVAPPAINDQTSLGLDTNEVIGGSRRIITNTPTAGTQVSTEINVGDSGVAALSSNFGTVSTWDFLWDAAGAGLNADLSGDTFLQVDFLDSDAGADVTVTIQDGDGTESVLLVTPGGPISLVYDFASFANTDFSNVQAIRLTVAGEANGDYAIEQVITDGGTVIPAPGAFAGGMVLMGVMGMIRRRRAA